MSSPVVHSFYHKETGTWSYVVADPATRVSAIIDPVLDYDSKSGRTSTTSAQQLVDTALQNTYRVEWILETHAHADHISAAPFIKKNLGGRIAIGRGITDVQKTFKPVFNLDENFATDGSQFDHLFDNDEVFSIGELQARIVPTPGHTNDSVSYLIGDAIFVGDSLFMPDGGSARCDFPGGNAALLYQSIHRLFHLPDATRMFVCHDYSPGGREPRCETTVGEQKRSNIHAASSVGEKEFIAMRTARDATLTMPALIIPSVQVNIAAGVFPAAEDNGVVYLKVPVDRL
ncbi:MAG TPA: MBL fold metallo-hydrolase [Arenimonas sp.]|nr:MBL fold metallo-hydrolase [Arenimonas sp.]HOZ04982.1 MBL fold metallo-hydrolase [Arenimonas sp.]HPO25268.1 MBL fold metallo-hydrolase [Arenimonas sp.]HPW32720.1 MBL fold metallo-hydrolase [Arenimonas sp.]